MTIDIQHVAKLAKLRLEEDQAQRFAKDMENIVSMVQQLPDLPDTGALIDPDHPMIFRGDVVEHHYDRKELLANAPQVKAGCVVVPNVVE